jgi:hypothetical protein
MHGQPRFAFTFIYFSKFIHVSYLRNLGSKTSLIVFTKWHSNEMIFSIVQYSPQALVVWSYVSMWNALMHFWMELKPTTPHASIFWTRFGNHNNNATNIRSTKASSSNACLILKSCHHITHLVAIERSFEMSKTNTLWHKQNKWDRMKHIVTQTNQTKLDETCCKMSKTNEIKYIGCKMGLNIVQKTPYCSKMLW